MAAECQHKSGMHVFEDAFILEVNDPGHSAAEGRRASAASSSSPRLFKHAAPMIRYNMNDVTSLADGRVRLRHRISAASPRSTDAATTW